MTLSEAYRILGLSTDATLAEVKTAYRRRVADAHPDRGGTAAEFIKVRAAYEILSGFLRDTTPRVAAGAAAGAPRAAGTERRAAEEEEEVPIPEDLRAVIDQIVWDFREHQRWAETEALRQLGVLEKHMSEYIQRATRAELRQFSDAFRASWNAILRAFLEKCNTRSDEILQRYESWYTQSTQAVFDDLYRKDLWSFAWRRRFWEVFAVLGAIAGALTVVIGWGASRRWISVAVLLAAVGVSFGAYWYSAWRKRQVRDKTEPLSVIPFQLPEDGRFATESKLRSGRRTTAAFGMAGLFLGSAAAGGFAVPAVAAVAGTALGSAFDRLINPTGRMREGMQADLTRFMASARPQVVRHVLDVHEELLAEVQIKITESYQDRVRSAVKLLKSGS
jgi:DnaJ-domain-containing protein 1